MFRIEKSFSEKGVDLKLSGYLTGQKVREELSNCFTLLMETKHKNINIDLEKVSQIDSRSIGTVVGLHLECKEKNIGLKIVNPSDHIKKVLKSANIHKVIPISD